MLSKYPQGESPKRALATGARAPPIGVEMRGWPISRILSKAVPLDDHSSANRVATAVKLPTRAFGLKVPVEVSARPRAIGQTFLRKAPIWHCSGWGLPCQSCCQACGGLLPHLFTITAYDMRQTILCGAFPGVAPAGRYPAPCLHGVRTFLGRKRPRSSSHPRDCVFRPWAGLGQRDSAARDRAQRRHPSHPRALWPRGESAIETR